MKKVLAVAGALAMLHAASASAAPGLNMAWNGCPIILANPSDISDPCDENGATHTLICSVRAPAGLSKVAGEEVILDLQEDSAVLSDWWHLESGGCMGDSPNNPGGSLAVGASFAGLSTQFCKDYWRESAVPYPYEPGWNYLPGYGGPNRARLHATFARSAMNAGPMTADVQYYVLKIILYMTYAVPDPYGDDPFFCAGCQNAMCIAFTELKLYQTIGAPNGDMVVANTDLRSIVSWQGGIQGYCFPVPVRRRTWGQVKSLYR